MIHVIEVKYDVDGNLLTPSNAGIVVQKNNLVNRVDILLKTPYESFSDAWNNMYKDVMFQLYCKLPNETTVTYPKQIRVPLVQNYFEDGYVKVSFLLDRNMSMESGFVECTLEATRNTGEVEYVDENIPISIFEHDGYRTFSLNVKESMITDSPNYGEDEIDWWDEVLNILSDWMGRLTFNGDGTQVLFNDGYYYPIDFFKPIIIPNDVELEGWGNGQEQKELTAELTDLNLYYDYCEREYHLKDIVVVTHKGKSALFQITDNEPDGEFWMLKKVNHQEIERANEQDDRINDIENKVNNNEWSINDIYQAEQRLREDIEEVQNSKATHEEVNEKTLEIRNALVQFQTAHTQEYNALKNKIENFLDVGDVTLDQLSEIIAFINTKEGASELAGKLSLKADKSTLEALYFNKNEINNILNDYLKISQLDGKIKELGYVKIGEVTGDNFVENKKDSITYSYRLQISENGKPQLVYSVKG